MNSTMESTPIEKLAANVLETRFENFDQATLENARNRVIDTVGCLIGGANDPSNPELVKLIKDYGGKEEATIFIHGSKVPAYNAAMLNSIMCRSFDFEPVSPLVDGIDIPGHISGTTVMTAISLGEANSVNGRELITALLVGEDVASRVLATSGFGFTAGWDNIGTVNALGATAIAGRLLGLNKPQMRNAFGLVFNQMCGSLQTVWDQTIAFKLLQGLSARNGIFSAQLAKAGWTGPEDALFSQFGYYKLFTEGCHKPEYLTKDLGRKYYSDGTFKPYPACRMTHAAIDCALALIQKYDIKAEDIQEAILYVSAGALDHICGHPFKIGSFPHANAAFSFQYTIATALLKKSVKPEHFTEQAIRDPQINNFINKIKLAERQGADMYGTKLKLIMKDGSELAEFCDVAKGDPLKNPMPKNEITAKFWTNVEFSRAVTREKAETLLNLLEKLEELDNVTRIVPLL